VFVKGGNGLLVPILVNVEAALLQAMHGLVVFGDYYIHQHEVCVGVEEG
jgi:hypothetical protein